MMEKIDWLTEMHRIADEKKGSVTGSDDDYIRKMMKIPNDDVSVERVTFKRFRSHLC